MGQTEQTKKNVSDQKKDDERLRALFSVLRVADRLKPFDEFMENHREPKKISMTLMVSFIDTALHGNRERSEEMIQLIQELSNGTGYPLYFLNDHEGLCVQLVGRDGSILSDRRWYEKAPQHYFHKTEIESEA